MNKKLQAPPMHRLLLIQLLVSVSLCLNYTLHLHSNSEFDSRCLDGTPAGLYTLKGSMNRLLIYFQGGGTCVGESLSELLDDCLARSKTDLGSSGNYPPTKSFEKYSVLSTDQTVNPLFYNWHKVYIPYCDGSLHQGSRADPISYKAQDLFFRGEDNTMAHLAYLNDTFKLDALDHMVMTGTSAGALAALLWSNYVRARLDSAIPLLILPDSGIFITDFVNPFTKKTPAIDKTAPLFKITNTEVVTPLAECMQKYPSQLECFHGGKIAEFIVPPVFVIQSEYDTWGIGNILQLPCATNGKPSNFSKCNDSEIEAIESYRQALLDALTNYTQIPRNGAWAISCAQHGFLDGLTYYDSENYLVPASSGRTILETLTSFIYDSGSSISIDPEKWPQNKKCSGIKQLLTTA